VLQIFSTAGELVGEIVLGSSPQAIESVSFEGEGVLRDPDNPLVLIDSSGNTIASWNGIGDDGKRVSSGPYILRIQSDNGLGSVAAASLDAIVSWKKVAGTASVWLVPNPAPRSLPQGLQISIQAPEGFRGNVRVYSIRGELIFNRHVDTPGDFRVEILDVPWASGLYLVLVKGADQKGAPLEALLRWAVL